MIFFQTFLNSLRNSFVCPLKPILKAICRTKRKFQKCKSPLVRDAINTESLRQSKEILESLNTPESVLKLKTKSRIKKKVVRRRRRKTNTDSGKPKRKETPVESKVINSDLKRRRVLRKLHQKELRKQKELQEAVMELQNAANRLVHMVLNQQYKAFYAKHHNIPDTIGKSKPATKGRLPEPCQNFKSKTLRTTLEHYHYYPYYWCSCYNTQLVANQSKNHSIGNIKSPRALQNFGISDEESKAFTEENHFGKRRPPTPSLSNEVRKNSQQIAKQYDFLYSKPINSEEVTKKRKELDPDKLVSDIKRPNQNYWVYYFQCHMPNCPPPSLVSLHKQKNKNKVNKNCKRSVKKKCCPVKKKSDNLYETTPERLWSSAEFVKKQLRNMKKSSGSSLTKVIFPKSMKDSSRRISGGASSYKPSTSFRAAMMGSDILPCAGKDMEEVDEEMEIEEEEVEEMEDPRCCGKEYCRVGHCWLKKNLEETPCRKREIEKLAGMLVETDSESDDAKEELCGKKAKCYYYEQHFSDDDEDLLNLNKKMPYAGTVYNTTFFRRHDGCETKSKKHKKPRKFFDIRTSYYPQERYPPTYNAYRTYSMTRLRDKVHSRQTPTEVPKSPIGTAKRCKREKVEKIQNTVFCPCKETEFFPKPCHCPKPPPPVPCTCVSPIQKCGCAQREAKLQDKYNLYNNRKILRRCILRNEESSDFLEPNQDPCDIKKKKFNIHRERYDRIDSKCPNAYCGTCYQDPNIEWSYEVKKIYCKKRCLEDILPDIEGEEECGECGDCEEESESCSKHDVDCSMPKRQFDTLEEREKRAERYPYNRIDDDLSDRIRDMLKQAFETMNFRPELEAYEEEEIECERDPYLEQKIESSDSLKIEECCPPRKRKSTVQKKTKDCRKLKEAQQEKQLMDACPTDIYCRYPCFCYVNPSLRKCPVSCYLKRWYCLPPKGIVDKSLFTDQILPNIESRRIEPRKQKRCNPWQPPL